MNLSISIQNTELTKILVPSSETDGSHTIWVQYNNEQNHSFKRAVICVSHADVDGIRTRESEMNIALSDLSKYLLEQNIVSPKIVSITSSSDCPDVNQALVLNAILDDASIFMCDPAEDFRLNGAREALSLSRDMENNTVLYSVPSKMVSDQYVKTISTLNFNTPMTSALYA